MKIQSVTWNNRKKCFLVQSTHGIYDFPYSKLMLKPTLANPLILVGPDPELGNTGFTYRLHSGEEDSVLVDQILEYHRDPEYMLNMLLYRMSVQAQEAMKSQGISKRELARQLKTSPPQLYRLLDQTFHGKTIDQMIKLLMALGCSVEIVMKNAA
mgnify:FL=1